MTIIYEPKGRALEYAPLAANLYSGCSHGCEYCYAPGALRRRKEVFHCDPKPRKNILDLLRKSAEKMNPDGRHVLLSFTTDPYQPIEDEFMITSQAIDILHDAGHSIEILTKGGMRAAKDFHKYGPNDKFATTMVFDNPKDAEQWEPGAASPRNRMRAMLEAHDRGIETWCSLEPVVYPEQTLNIIEMTSGYVDLYKVGTLNHSARAKEINWEKFYIDVTTLLINLNKAFYIKNDLRAYAPKG